MISATSTGSYEKTAKFLNTMKSGSIFRDLHRYGRQGVDALASATPRDTGETATSWGYQIGHTGGVYSISWYNTNRVGQVNVAVILQFGHGTGTGGWVEGVDYINPAIKPIFEKAVNDIWRQVKNA